MTDKEIDYKILQRENENLLKANKDLVREIDALGEENKRLKALFAEYIKPIDKFIKDRENKAVKDCEKVKEIKKALETCMHTRVSSCRECPYNYTNTKTKHSECFRMAEHALTLINELENENEWLRLERDVLIGKKIVEKQKYDNALMVKIDIQKQLKNRIAELEKENKSKTDTITDLLKKQEFYEKDKLKQFAERLKKRTILYSGINVKYEAITADIIDEVLKEYEE